MENQLEIRNEILSSIESLINRGKLKEAKEIIENYEKKIQFDTNIYSMKAVICVTEGDLKQAKNILLRGLLLDICNFDILYNLAYVYEEERNYIKSVYFYNYASIYCEDYELKGQIINKIDEIKINRAFEIEESIYDDKFENNQFEDLLIKKLLQNANEYHIDNVDYERFGDNANNMNTGNENKKTYISENLNSFNSLFDELCDEKSKSILVDIIAYRILGNKKIKLPLSNRQYFIDRKNSESLIKEKDAIKINFMNWKLSYFELDKVGYPIKIYYLPVGIYNTFILKQYNYVGDAINIKPEKDDIIIDAGGCFGDTALRFAYDVGEKGRVYTFEFMPSNLEIMNKNFNINQEVSSRINVINQPVSSKTGEEFYCFDNGPGSTLSKIKDDKNNIYVSTIAIDDFAKENKIDKVDFIKMDIEGAELGALIGSVNTIKKYKPKLAISLYHNIKDFIEISEYINSLELGYKFYLDHYTIFSEDTVLYAIV